MHMDTCGYYDIVTTLEMQMHILNGYTAERVARKFGKNGKEAAEMLYLFHRDLCANCLIGEDLSECFVNPDFVITVQSAYEYLCRKYEGNEAFRFCIRESGADELFDRLIKHVILMYGEEVFWKIPAEWGGGTLREPEKSIYR